MFYDYLIVSFYGLLLTVYISSQIFYATRERDKQGVLKSLALKKHPFVSVLVPFYNETFEEIDATINSLLNLKYPENHYEIIVVDDGSKDILVFRELFQKYKSNSLVKILRKYNEGKRVAQVFASAHADNRVKYFLTVDSDTVFDMHCLEEMVKVAEHFQVQAVTGGVLVKPKSNFLNRLLRIRYWAANWQERLSQSWFNQVSCCSGPCSLWCAKTFLNVKCSYISQKFFGKACTYGDDRHLTNLFLLKGCRIKMACHSVCYTSTPETWLQWCRQQFRWSKSFYRESLWSAENLRGKVGWYFIYQNVFSFLLPFILIFSLGYHLLVDDLFSVFCSFILSVSLAGLVRGLYAFIFTLDSSFFLAPVYGFIHFVVVFPIRVYALFRLKDMSWSTR